MSARGPTLSVGWHHLWMTYSFRNRFRLLANRVDSKEPELVLDCGGGEKIVLGSGRGGPLSETGDLVIQGGGYSRRRYPLRLQVRKVAAGVDCNLRPRKYIGRFWPR